MQVIGQSLKTSFGVREQWIDAWKGWLIFLVVLGHIAGALAHHSAGPANNLFCYAYKWIYLFHMPAFFFLAGYVAQRSSTQPPFATFIRSRARRLLIPYFFWGIVSAAIYTFAIPLFSRLMQGQGGYYGDWMTSSQWWQPFVALFHAGGWPVGFRFNSVLWFLPAMFTTQLFDWALAKTSLLSPSLPRRAVVTLLLLTVALFVLGGYLRLYPHIILPWALDLVPYYLGFLLIGRLSYTLTSIISRTFSRLNSNTLTYSLSLILFSYIVTLLPNMCLARLHWKWYFAELGMAIWGCLLSLNIARQLKGARWATLGVVSLGIMLLHKYPILAIQMGLTKFAPICGHFNALLLLAGITLVVLAITLPIVHLITRRAPILFGAGRTSRQSRSTLHSNL